MSSATGKQSCPTCAFSWIRTAANADKKECPKCNTKLPVNRAAAAPVAAARGMGDKSAIAPSAGSAMEATGGVCSLGGAHTYKFGMCSKCKVGEGKSNKGPGAAANPGAAGAAGCPKGGKHMYKFSKCSKCGASEL